MTRTTNARLAGFTFLFYIATGITSLVLFRQATGGAEGDAALASLAQHATTVRLTAVLTLLAFFEAVVLGVTLYALTRDQDPDLAILALCCRAAEGVVAAIAADQMLGLLSVATASTAAVGADLAATQALGVSLLRQDGSGPLIAASCFAVGSALFSYLFLRARSIPVPLAWLGLLASVLLSAVLTLRIAGFLQGPVTYYVWIPMAVFEVALALWLIIKGVAAPQEKRV